MMRPLANEHIRQAFRAGLRYFIANIIAFVIIFIGYAFIAFQQYNSDIYSVWRQLLALTVMTLCAAIGTCLYIYSMYKGIGVAILGEPFDEMSADCVGVLESQKRHLQNNIEFAKSIIGISTSVCVAFSATFLSDTEKTAQLLSVIGWKPFDFITQVFMFYVIFSLTALLIARDLWNRIKVLINRIEQLHREQHDADCRKQQVPHENQFQCRFDNGLSPSAGMIMLIGAILWCCSSFIRHVDGEKG